MPSASISSASQSAKATRISLVDDDLRDIGVALTRAIVRLALVERVDVDGGHVRQQRRADRAVRGVEHPADHPGEAVNRAQLGICQRQAAEQTGQRHCFAGARSPKL